MAVVESPEQRITRLRRVYRERVEAQDATTHPGYAVAWDAIEGLVLRHGGSLVVPPAAPDPMLNILTKDGVVIPSDHTERIAGVMSDCHTNVVHLWRNGGIVAIGTGYALNGDLWREHSWGWDIEDRIVETTEERDRYFGIRMAGDQAKWFADWIDPPQN